jgi:two-component system, OmpR family, response regulator
MAARSAALAGGDSTLVRHFQPINWRNDRTPRRLVRHLVDDLGNQPGCDRKGINKVIEADFLPRGTNAFFSRPRSIGGSGVKERRRILIVDNDSNTTHLVKVLLERTGHYLVQEENEPTKAHQSARNFRPDLILLDVVMPETDGGEVAAQIEVDPELHNTRIVFLTALVTRAEARSGLHIQGHPFLAKPVSIPELIDAIEQQFPVRVASHVSL